MHIISVGDTVLNLELLIARLTPHEESKASSDALSVLTKFSADRDAHRHSLTAP